MQFLTIFAAFIFAFAAHASPSQRYPAKGLVLAVDRSHRTIGVSCQPIQDFNGARIQHLWVRSPAELEPLHPGSMIDFTLVVGNNSASAEEIRIHHFQNTEQEPMAAQQMTILQALVAPDSASAPAPAIGQTVPDFFLVDQRALPVRLSQFRGAVVAISFIYTTCPLPNFCFRLSNNFGVLKQRFANRLGQDLFLLSITFDPVHDRPEVLSNYARTWQATDIPGWRFLTGDVSQIRRVCQMFDVNFWQDEAFMTHTLHTVLLDRDGRLVANLEGNEFTADQLGDLVETLLPIPPDAPRGILP